MPDPQVLLVREWDEQVTGSGCCGRLGGENCEISDGAAFERSRADMEAMGAVYRALRAELTSAPVSITVVDPRNMFWLLPSMWRAARRRGMTRRQTWYEIRRGTANASVVVNGRTLFSGSVPDTYTVVEAVRSELFASDIATI